MENKQLVIVGVIGLAILLGILAIFQSNNSPEIGGGFLDINKAQNSAQPSAQPAPAVTELSGQDLKVGSGSAVVAGDKITVHYIGMFMDGKPFDSSYERNQPFTVQIGASQVIPGFEQGVLGMKVGGKRRLFIPASLAYGEKGQGAIPPNTPLAFDIELLSIESQEASPVEEVAPTASVTPQESPTPSPAP